MAVDHRLGGLVVLVEPGAGHRGLELLDLRLALGDAALEIGDALAQAVELALFLLALGVFTFSRLSIQTGIRDSGFGIRGRRLWSASACGVGVTRRGLWPRLG